MRRGVIDSRKHEVILEYKEREKSHTGFIIEGERLIKRAVDDGLMLRSIIYNSKSGLERDGYIDKAGCDCYRAGEGIISAVSTSKPVPLGVALCVMPEYKLDEIISGGRIALLITDCVNNPDNLGLIIRTADACGVDAVIVTGIGAAPYNKNCVRASRGAIGRLPTLYYPDGVAALVAELKSAGVIIIGSDIKADIMLGDVRNSWQVPEKFALIVGNESVGMSVEMCDMCDIMIKIEMAQGRQSSFNVAVAAGIILNRLIGG